VSGVEITSLWTMSAWTLLPVVLLSSPRITVGRRQTVYAAAFAAVLPLILLAAAPLIAFAIHRGGDLKPSAAQASLLAERVAQVWRESTERPLRLVGGEPDLAYGTAFYLPGRPTPVPAIEVVGQSAQARIARDGVALVCLAADQPCRAAAERVAGPGSRRVEVELARRFLGVAGRPARYLIVVIPPQG
jgi:hypothetical protein